MCVSEDWVEVAAQACGLRIRGGNVEFWRNDHELSSACDIPYNLKHWRDKNKEGHWKPGFWRQCEPLKGSEGDPKGEEKEKGVERKEGGEQQGRDNRVTKETKIKVQQTVLPWAL